MFLMRDSRSNNGSRASWWAETGYTTDINLARVFSEEEAKKQNNKRPTDIPVPVSYLNDKKVDSVDFQYICASEAESELAPGIDIYIQANSFWDGNDIAFISKKTRPTCALTSDNIFKYEDFLSLKSEGISCSAWPESYLRHKIKSVVKADLIDHKKALKETSIVLKPIEKPRKAKHLCAGCGRYISTADAYSSFCCSNCGSNIGNSSYL